MRDEPNAQSNDRPMPETEAGDDPGRSLHAMATRLFPLHRSQTGDGVRATIAALREWAPFETREVPSGTKVFDWTVPPEWNVHDAYVKDDAGQRVIAVAASSLHLVNGSVPVRRKMQWSELKPHLHTLPDQPDLVPYITGFFRDMWGFCLSQRDFDTLEAKGEKTYEVVVDTTVKDGALSYGECVLPGESTDEVLFAAHICHPSLANDNLSGLCVAAYLARHLAAMPRRRFTYRFLLAPATIGAIAWLSVNRDQIHRIRHGLVLSLLGDKGGFTYKHSRQGDAMIDRVVSHVLAASDASYEERPFTPWGYDERQFCSPGINLPMGRLTRTPDGEFPEYHTSGDNLDFVRPEALGGSFETLKRIVDVLENDRVFRNQRPFGEPRLAQHGLYQSLPEDQDRLAFQQATQWVLNLADGRHSLLDMAERSGLDFALIQEVASRLEACGLLREDERKTT